MKSAAAKGQYYKSRTKAWLEQQGYQVGFLERTLLVYGRKDANGRPLPPFPIKKDQFGSDLLAMAGDRLVFVQCKLGRKNVAAAMTQFRKFVFATFTEQWVVVWEKGAREPHIFRNVRIEPEPDIPFPRTPAKATPLCR